MDNNMINNTDILEKLALPRIIDIPGLALRGFRSEEDYPKMLKVIHGSREVDGLERAENLEDILNTYNLLVHCDPYHDMLFAEVNGEVVGYCRVWWAVEGSGQWIGFQLGNVLPEWRSKGIGSTLLRFNEMRLHQIATQLKESGELPADAACLMDNFASSSETARINLLEQ